MSFSVVAAALLAQPSPVSPTPAAPAARGTQWTLAASDTNWDFLLDPDSVAPAGGVVRFRMKLVPRRQRGEPAESGIGAYQLDCSAQTVAMESLEAFNAAGRLIATRIIPADWLDRDPIYAGTTDEKIYLRVCPASARKPLAGRPPPPPMIVAAPVPPAPPPMILVAPPSPPPPPPPPVFHPARPAEPVVPLGSLFSADDYPAAALRAEEQGIVRYRLAIDRQGRVTACVITSSSGSASLDSATCRLLTQRARFRPARGSDGKRSPDVLTSQIHWRIPEEPAPPAQPPAQR